MKVDFGLFIVVLGSLFFKVELSCMSCDLDIADKSQKAADIDLIYPLHTAASSGDVAQVNALCSGGSCINVRDFMGRTPLMEAAEEGHAEVVALLLNKGALVDAVDEDGETALIKVAEAGHVSVVRILMDHKADVNASESLGYTALRVAVEHSYMELIKELLRFGARVGKDDLLYAKDTKVKRFLEKALKFKGSTCVALEVIPEDS